MKMAANKIARALVHFDRLNARVSVRIEKARSVR